MFREIQKNIDQRGLLKPFIPKLGLYSLGFEHLPLAKTMEFFIGRNAY